MLPPTNPWRPCCLEPALALVASLLLGGCSGRKECEAARDTLSAKWEAGTKAALAVVDAEDRKEGEVVMARGIDHLRGVFLETCLAQPAITLECVPKLDALAKIDVDRRHVRVACDYRDKECAAAADATASAVFGDCAVLMNAMREADEKHRWGPKRGPARRAP